MTIEHQRTISSLELAKALHPAAAGRPRPPQHDERGPGTQPPVTATGPAAEVLAVLWEEEVCRARLGSVAHGWLSWAARPGRLPITIAAVEGDDVLLVVRESTGVGGVGSGRPAALEVGGVTAGSGRWSVRASGLLQAVVREGPSRSTGLSGGSAFQDDLSSETGGFAVLALTISSIRGFETPGRPAHP